MMMILSIKKLLMMSMCVASAFQSTLGFTISSHQVARGRPLSQSNDFWEEQRELMQEMSGEKSMKADQKQKYVQRRDYLLGDTAYLSVLFFAALWLGANTPFTPISYAFGTFCGLLYAYGLSKYVESIGEMETEGAVVGQARFVFLFLLFIFIGKFRSLGLQEIPAILGFFTYQLSSLGQGLREIND